jgi:hypothetical protein
MIPDLPGVQASTTRVPHLKYCVIRVSDQIGREAKATATRQLDADTWLMDYLRLVGAKIVQ